MQGDEDDWTMRYPSELVGWLVDVLESIDWRWSAVEVLETERAYPGLVNDIGTEVWQRRLVDEQMKSDKG